MSDFHPLQSRIAESSVSREDIQIFRGTTFRKQFSLEYNFPAFPGANYGSYMNNFRSVEELVVLSYENNQMVYVTIPVMLEYDRIEFIVTAASNNLSKPGQLVLHKYFSPIVDDDPDGFMVPLELTAEETGLLAKSEYDYKIILEHLGNRVGEYLNITTFGYRHLAAYGKVVIKG